MTDAGTALITGANRGIGLAIAVRLAELGYRVAITARDSEHLARAAERLESSGATVATISADLRDPAAPDTIIRAVAARLGPVDLLINNAGTAPSEKLENTSDETLDEVLDLHVRAPFKLIRAVIPEMKARQRGCIIQMSSTAGLRGFALITAYTAAKHAMVGLTRALAVELSRTPIRSYAICPGFVDTDITRAGAAKVARLGKHTEEELMNMYGAMNKCGRLLQPEEVAHAVGELADPDCRIPSGSIYELDDMPPSILRPE